LAQINVDKIVCTAISSLRGIQTLIAAQKHMQSVLVSLGELCTAGACTKRLDETKWSETSDETPRPSGPRPRR